MHLSKNIMKPILIILNTLFLVLIFSCASTVSNSNDFYESDIIIATEKIFNEFKDNEESAMKRYKNKQFQANGDVLTVLVNAKIQSKKFPLPATVTLEFDNYRFDFGFDYDVQGQYSIKQGDRLIIQGILKNYFKIMDSIGRISDSGEKFWERVEVSCFQFDSSKIIGIIDSKDEVSFDKKYGEDDEL